MTLLSVATILIVDPDAANRSLLELLCLRLGHRPIGSREWVEGEEPQLLLLEPASRTGLRLARGVRRRFPHLPILYDGRDGLGSAAIGRALCGERSAFRPPLWSG